MRLLKPSYLRSCSETFATLRLRHASTQRGTYDQSATHDAKSRDVRRLAILATAAAGGLATYGYYTRHNSKVFAARVSKSDVPAPEKIWPVYALDEVEKHATRDSVWMVHGSEVFDVTDFVKEHPGGDVILQAAGSSVDPFWDVYSVHKESKDVRKVLERCKIGVLDPKDIIEHEASDAFAFEPKRSDELLVLSKTPFNAEAPHRKLAQKFITPNECFYVRNHLPVPIVNVTTYALDVSCPETKKSLKLTMDELKTKFQPVTITCAVQCAGNRRDGINSVKKTMGLEWKLGAISNAKWTGARLRDILIELGISDENKKNFKHVIFQGWDQTPTGDYYGASIPIDKAMAPDGDVIVAWEMNGETLPRDHGFPLRLLAPGIIGARNVKWLQSIEVSQKESKSHWQQNDYKLFSPSTDARTADFSASPAIQQGNVQSAICTPLEGDVIQKGQPTRISGYAWSGGGRAIVRVDVSVDGCKTWHLANLEQDKDQGLDDMWAWTLWSIDLPMTPNSGSKEAEIVVKATDSSYNPQPETADGIWNFRGLLNNSWHRVTVKVA